MRLPVRIHEAADFYDIESLGLSAEFADEIEHAVEHTSLYPHASPVARGSLRAKTPLRFPYSLVYFVGEIEITLLAVAHQKRRPFYWTSRL